MNFISALLFGISANIDAFVTGFSYGIKKQRIPVGTNLIISFITFGGTLFSIWLGLKIADFVPPLLSRAVGSTLLILLGLFYCIRYVWELLRRKKQPPGHIHAQSEATLTRKEAAALGLTLTANNAGMGIGASFAGIHVLLTSLITLFFCGLFLITGNRVGSRWASSFLKQSADIFSGLIIILLGIYELLF